MESGSSQRYPVKGQGQWTQTEIQEISLKREKKLVYSKSGQTFTQSGFPERLWSLRP